MNNKKNANSVFLDESLTPKQADGTKYKLRTECKFDCELIRGILRPWILSWKESAGYPGDQSYLDKDGVLWVSMNDPIGADIEVIVKPDAPSLNELRWLIDKLMDCHVGAESMDFAECYTGTRLDYFQMEAVKKCPSKKVLRTAMKALLQRIELSEMTIEISRDAWNSLSLVSNQKSRFVSVGAKQ